jgi:DNA-binding NtrC family response regulator
LNREILPEDIKDEMRREKFVYDEPKATKPLSEKLADYEKELLRAALQEHKWNQSRAARALQIPVQTLRYKMSKLGIELAKL